MLVCPRCSVRLTQRTVARATRFGCGTCEGQAITLSALRRAVSSAAIGGLWRASSVYGPAQLACPSCRKAMTAVPITPLAASEGPVQLDVCRRCHLVWFDHGEEHDLPALPAPTRDAAAPELSQASREQLARMKVEQWRRDHDLSAPPSSTGGQILGWAGLPLLERMSKITKLVPVTWALLSLMIFASVWCWSDPWIGREFSFMPSDPWRYAGMTLPTSFLLHAGAMHLIGNGYFLVVVGPHVEALLGSARFLALIVAGALAGLAGHAWLAPNLDVRVLGASAGISALLVMCALAFPGARVRFLFVHRMLALRGDPPWRWVALEIRVALMVWIAGQLAGAVYQAGGRGSVSYGAHLGGAAAGLVAWLLWRAGPSADRAEHGEAMSVGELS